MKHRHVDWLVFVIFIIVSLLDFYPRISLNACWAKDKASAPIAIIDELTPKIDTLSAKELIALGNAYSATNNHISAIKTYQLAFSKNEKDAESKTLIGKEQFLYGKESAALITLREAIDINPKYEDAYLWLAKFYEKRNNKYELRMLYSDMIDKIGEKLEYVMKLCGLSTESGLYDSAKKYCRRGIVLNKEEPSNYVNLAIAFKETGSMAEAKSLMKRAADNFKSSDFAQVTYAQFLLDTHDYTEAAMYFKNATLARPSSYEGWLGIALSSIEIQKFQQSLDAFTEACKLKRAAVGPLRKSVLSLRNLKQGDWASKLDELADSCGPLPGPSSGP